MSVETISLSKETAQNLQPGFFRSRFHIPQHEDRQATYFLGNSLGLQPVQTQAYLEQVLQQWAAHGVESFFRGNNPWLSFHQSLQPTLSQIVGARPHEVVAMNQLTVNLHLLLVSFYRPVGKRNKILCEAKAFPSDQYMLYSHVLHRGLKPEEAIVEVHPREGETTIRHDDILAAIAEHQDELALVFWGGVNYYTGQVFDMKAISETAHAVGALVGFDLAHAAGNVALELHDWDADFAAWCSYKYLNAGPGGVGCAFVHERHHNDASLHRFAGWWGNKKETQFLMEQQFVPEASAEGWQLSTPSPLLYASLKASLDLFEEPGVQSVLAANKDLTTSMRDAIKQVEQNVPAGALRILTPDGLAGCQLSLEVKNGKLVFEHLSSEGIYADWREPAVIRIAPVAFYNTVDEVHRFAHSLQFAINKYAS